MRELGQQIRTRQDMATLVNWSIACCVLHNMLSLLGDVWEEEFAEMGDVEGDDHDDVDVNARFVDATAFKEHLKATTL